MPFPLVPIAVGAGLGLAGSLFGPDQETSTQTTTLDPRQQAYLQQIRALLLGAQGMSGPEEYGQAGQAYAGLLPGLGLAGEMGLGGVDQYFDPYQGDVIQGLQNDFDRQRQLAIRRAADTAVGSGAFGGSRSAVLEAQGTRDVNDLEASTIGRFRSAGFQQAVMNLMAERARVGQLGLAGAGGLAAIGQARSADELQRLQLLGLGLGGGSTTTITNPLYSNPFAGALGGAATLGGLFDSN